MSWKRRRSSTYNPMDAENAKAKLAAVAEEVGRIIRVFKISPSSASPDEGPAASISQNDEPDEFYELTPADYFAITANKMGAQFLKTRKIREAEAAARRAKLTKAVIRVRFPDSYVVEANFRPSETIQDIMDFLSKVVARKDLPFYIYTTPPKQRIKDMSKDLYSAGLAPGAIVYFAYDLPNDADSADVHSVPFLRDDIFSLNGLDLIPQQPQTVQSKAEDTTVPVECVPVLVETNTKPASKPKPKWFKM